ncbi:MAG: CRTAC1 family protein [Phycisphaerae bacterium]
MKDSWIQNGRGKRWLAGLGACALVGWSPTALASVPFTEEAVARGLVYEMQPAPQTTGYLGFGCAMADLDRDGDQDIVLLGRLDGTVGVFENDGSGTFTDHSGGSGIPALEAPSSLAIADYDGDGLVDIYLTQTARNADATPLPNLLMRNLGGFQFTDVTVSAGVGDLGDGKGASWGDFDGDEWLDLYVCNYPGIIGGANTANLHNRLYRNLGNGSFQDVAPAQGVNNDGKSFEAVWFDMDRDGDVDLYLSNDRGAAAPFRNNQLWENVNGSLVNISAASNADVALDSMGLACGDFDGNGVPDLYCTNIPGVGGMDNPLLLNQGGGVFVESSVAAGVENAFSGPSWGSIFFDIDNNATLDLYVNNMFADNTLYSNPGTFPCTEMATVYQAVGNAGSSFSSAVGDVDGDGDLDLLLNNLGPGGLGANVELLINHEGETRTFVRYEMVGVGNNACAVGGNTDTRVGSVWQFREILAGGNSYNGQNELIMHVGLDTATTVDEVTATWPGGNITRTLTNLPVGFTWKLYPPERLGDANNDALVTAEDFPALAACYQATFVPGCEVMDFDGNSHVNALDFAAFLDAFDGVPADCNANGMIDFQEMLANGSLDADQDGLLDDCTVGLPIPTMSQWGLMMMMVGIVTLGTLVYTPRRQSTA